MFMTIIFTFPLSHIEPRKGRTAAFTVLDINIDGGEIYVGETITEPISRTVLPGFLSSTVRNRKFHRHVVI